MKKYCILVIFLSLVICIGCSSESTDTDMVDGRYEGEEKDLAQYLYTDISETAKELGGFENTEKGKDPVYENHTAILKGEMVDGTEKIYEIQIVGPGNYNLFGIKYDTPITEAKAIIEKECSNVEEKYGGVSGNYKDEQGIEHRLTIYPGENPNFVSLVAYSIY